MCVSTPPQRRREELGLCKFPYPQTKFSLSRNKWERVIQYWDFAMPSVWRKLVISETLWRGVLNSENGGFFVGVVKGF